MATMNKGSQLRALVEKINGPCDEANHCNMYECKMANGCRVFAFNPTSAVHYKFDHIKGIVEESLEDIRYDLYDLGEGVGAVLTVPMDQRDVKPEANLEDCIEYAQSMTDWALRVYKNSSQAVIEFIPTTVNAKDETILEHCADHLGQGNYTIESVQFVPDNFVNDFVNGFRVTVLLSGERDRQEAAFKELKVFAESLAGWTFDMDFEGGTKEILFGPKNDQANVKVIEAYCRDNLKEVNYTIEEVKEGFRVSIGSTPKETAEERYNRLKFQQTRQTLSRGGLRQAEAIALHYSSMGNIAQHLLCLNRSRQQGVGDRKTDTVIFDIADRIKNAHQEDFGLPLEWKPKGL